MPWSRPGAITSTSPGWRRWTTCAPSRRAYPPRRREGGRRRPPGRPGRRARGRGGAVRRGRSRPWRSGPPPEARTPNPGRTARRRGVQPVRVTDLTVRLYRIPPPIRIQDSIQRVSHSEWVVTTLATDAGLTGTGFAYTSGFGGTAIRELVGTYVAPLVRGQDPRNVERIWSRCWWELHALGSGGLTRYALAGVDIALWDILAQHA